LAGVRRFLGLFIAAAFGVVFVMVNTAAPLDPAVRFGLRGLAVAAFAGLAVVSVLLGRQPADVRDGRSGGEVRTDRFGRGYWAVVVAEVICLFGGFQVLRILDAPKESGVAWVAVVVGLHFVAFLWVWKQRSILVPGTLLTAYGVAGLIMATTSSVAWVPFVSGVLSGITLLVCCLYVVLNEYRRKA
jgi:hypothetical protein